MFPRTGYYVIERKKLGQATEDTPVISFMEFMRRVRRKDIAGQLLVCGFEEAARIWANSSAFVGYMRANLRPLTSTMFKEGGIVIFVVGGNIIGNGKPVVRCRDLEIELANIFGADRIEQEDSLVYSPPNIP